MRVPTSAPPVTRLTTPGGMPDLLQHLHEVDRRQRRQRRRLEDDGVAADQRRRDLPRRDRHREIPRRDHRADAERLAHRHRELVAQLRGHRLPVLPAALAGHELRHVDRFLHVAARLLEHLPHLARHVAREGFLLLDKACGRRQQQLGTLGRGHEPPRLVGPRRRVERGVRVGRGRVLEQPNHVARRPPDSGSRRSGPTPTVSTRPRCSSGKSARSSLRPPGVSGMPLSADRLQREPERRGKPGNSDLEGSIFDTPRFASGNRLLRKGLAPKTTCGPRAERCPALAPALNCRH